MDALIDLILAYAGPIGVALCLLAVWLWHRFVEPITGGFRVRYLGRVRGTSVAHRCRFK